MTYHEWITDSTIDAGSGWGYVEGQGFKTVDNLVTNLVDSVSKNGYLLLNVGPKADGSIPEEAKRRLLALGKWLKINGEAIYGTTPWVIAAEGRLISTRRDPLTKVIRSALRQRTFGSLLKTTCSMPPCWDGPARRLPSKAWSAARTLPRYSITGCTHRRSSPSRCSETAARCVGS